MSKTEGPEIRIITNCINCKFVELRASDHSCHYTPVCKLLTKTLNKQYEGNSYRIITDNDCPFIYKIAENMCENYINWHSAVCGEIYLHKKGGLYKILKIVSEQSESGVEYKVEYLSLKDNDIHIRSKSEFEDGRFIRIIKSEMLELTSENQL